MTETRRLDIPEGFGMPSVDVTPNWDGRDDPYLYRSGHVLVTAADGRIVGQQMLHGLKRGQRYTVALDPAPVGPQTLTVSLSYSATRWSPAPDFRPSVSG